MICNDPEVLFLCIFKTLAINSEQITSPTKTSKDALNLQREFETLQDLLFNKVVLSQMYRGSDES